MRSCLLMLGRVLVDVYGLGIFCCFLGLYGEGNVGEWSLQDHWDVLPVAEQQLGAHHLPENCAVCHMDKLQEWTGSQHSKAFSPGLVGQLMNYSDEGKRSCLECHAPLSEQFNEALTKGNLNKWARKRDLAFAGHGVMCASCHLREGAIVGPVNVSPELTKGHSAKVHPQARQVEWFTDSQFCARCHQFPQSAAINGKPLENTYQEWLESRFLAEGKTCQSCHMPDKKHLFRGIHDKEMVLSGVVIKAQIEGGEAVLRMTSTNIGHAFPTYVVPRVELVGIFLGRDNKPLIGTERKVIIQRIVDREAGHWVEKQDTRLKPGEAAELRLKVGVDVGGVQFKIRVVPDHYYMEAIYKPLLKEAPSGASRNLIEEALKKANENSYILYETVLPLK